MQVVFEGSKPVTDHIETFYFRLNQPVHYTAGQFIELTLPHDRPDARGMKHWFTLSSSPTEEFLSITTKFNPEHSSTFKEALKALEAGQTVQMSDPMGDFVLPKDTNRPLVFVAGGMGITPMRSMVKWLHDNQEHRTIRLIYAASVPEEFAFRELFAEYGLPVTLVASHPPAKWEGESGLLTAERILEIAPNVDNKLYYLSGPEPMVETFYKELKELGLKESQLVTDYFPGYEAIQ